MLIRKNRNASLDVRFGLVAESAVYCIPGAASVIVLMLSGVILGDSWIFAVCFMLIADCDLLMKLFNQGFQINRCLKICIGTAVAYGCILYGVVLKDISRTYDEAQYQIQQIEEQITIPLLTPTGNRYNAARKTPNVDKDKISWFNQWMALYYGVDSITGTEP